MKLHFFLFIASALTAQAQYEIKWFTFDGGGGTSTGGVYSVSGTIGQPDAGNHQGGNVVLSGGFWGVMLAIQTADAPLLSIAYSNNAAIVYWPLPATGFVLDETRLLMGSPAISWAQVPFPYQTNATHVQITVPMPTGDRFYRLRKP